MVGREQILGLQCIDLNAISIRKFSWLDETDNIQHFVNRLCSEETHGPTTTSVSCCKGRLDKYDFSCGFYNSKYDCLVNSHTFFFNFLFLF